MSWFDAIQQGQGWQSNFLWFLLAIPSSIITGVIVYLITRERKILEYKIESTQLITKNMSQIEGLQITLDGKPVESLTSTSIIFLNSGNRAIRFDTFFRDSEPFGLSIKDDGIFFGGQNGIKTLPETSRATPEIQLKNRKQIKI